MAKVFCKDWSMERTDLLISRVAGNLEECLYLLSVFSYDTDEIASCFVIPRFFCIESTEFAETVSRKENFSVLS